MRKWKGRMRQTEKLAPTVAATEASARPIRSSRAGMALWVPTWKEGLGLCIPRSARDLS